MIPNEDAEPRIAAIPDEGVPEVLRAIVRDLQVNPTRYRWFGAWWWPIKAMLIRAGHRPLLGSMLGPALDPEAIATLPRDLSPGRVLAEGLDNYQWAGRFERTAEWVTAPNGNRIRIYDPDVET